MKIRQSFVANSSSSSFIVIYKEISYEDQESIFVKGIIPDNLKDKLFSYTNKSLSDAYDVVTINDKTIETIIKNGLVDELKYNTVEVVEKNFDEGILIKEEYVNCKVMHYEKDYHSTNEDVILLITRYEDNY